MSTERPSPRYSEIDSWEPGDALEAMIDGQFAAVAAVRAARSAIEQAAKEMETRLRYRGRLIYVGADTDPRPSSVMLPSSSTRAMSPGITQRSPSITMKVDAVFASSL